MLESRDVFHSQSFVSEKTAVILSKHCCIIPYIFSCGNRELLRREIEERGEAVEGGEAVTGELDGFTPLQQVVALPWQ